MPKLINQDARKDIPVMIRMTKKETNTLDKLCKKCGVASRSEMIRQLIKEAK